MITCRRVVFQVVGNGRFALAYFVAGKAGLRLAYLDPRASPVWPPAGIALIDRARGSDEFDSLISDVGLPDATGVELISRLREAREIRGIAISGLGMDGDLARNLGGRFAVHLTKPLSFQTLEVAIAGDGR